MECIEAKDIFEVINHDTIDLLKINVEGAEYEIIDNLIESNTINKIKSIQVQFHCVNKYTKIYDSLSNKLSNTHTITWRYPFVWENWTLK